MNISTNTSALYAHRQVANHQKMAEKAQGKLVTGLRVNQASDDAAGLAISEKMRAQIRGLNQASRNTQDGISLIQTSEAALNETHHILQRLRELTVQAANDTYKTTDRVAMQKEFDNLSEEIDRIASSTTFNNHSLLTGQKDFSFQIGANAGQTISVKGAGMSTTDLGLTVFEPLRLTGLANEVRSETTVQIGRARTASEPGMEIVGYYDANGKEGPGYYIEDELKYGAAVPEQNGTYHIQWEGKSYQITLNDETVTTVTPTLDFSDSTGEVHQASWFEATENREAGYYKEDSLIYSSLTPLPKGQAVTIQESLLTDQDSGVFKTLSITTREAANDTITKLDQAIALVSKERSYLGSSHNRLEHALSNLLQTSENLQAAESRIRGVDMAEEIMVLTKQNLLANVAQSVLAQANQQPSQVLTLLA
ncbi:flagellin [Shouchella sp. JSM 1781072]|uniref:flagellin N-terminal helical domain-containing protein n=1 Tax=Shouchella sp. JSM 1781072 TaxID=3344581 RepID=UPI0035BF2A71